jgi:hypothetical protein
MKVEVREIVGRRISGVVVKRCWRRSPQSQVFLLFDDGTYYEFYCLDSVISTTAGVLEGGPERVRRYMAGPDLWPTFVALADTTGAERLLHDVALGRVVDYLRGGACPLNTLASELQALSQEGWNWRLLYEEALQYRNPDDPEPPTLDELNALPGLAPPLDEST